MALNIAIPLETKNLEKRVAASPETVKKLIGMGCLVSVQKGAGLGASFTDKAYKDAGAKIVAGAVEIYKGANIVLKVQAPSTAESKSLKKGTLLLALMAPHNNGALIKSLASAGVDIFAMEMVPRISRAQSMDVLSSQSNLAGYKAVLDATEHYGSAFPMMMTAAGTVPPAKVFVMGAGVAGLQAIATAKRLGAVVTATDVRPAAKEQVQSLGGNFVAVEDEEFKQAETTTGYAKPMSATYQKKQAALVAEHIAKQDVVITTALIPGRPAPKLISEAMVKSMKQGSVIVDMAVETGGNCALSEAGKVIVKNGVTLIGHLNMPSRLAADTSALYARNIFNLLKLIIDDKGKLAIDWEDEIIQGLALSKGGKIIHPSLKATPAAAKKKATSTTKKKTVVKKTAPAKKKPSTAKKTTTAKKKTTTTKKKAS